MMKKSEINKRISTHYKTILKELDFRYYSNKFRGSGFEKKTEFGSHTISFSLADYSKVFYCIPSISIRFDEVQNVYNAIASLADWAKPFSTTISISLDKLVPNSDFLSDRGYKIESEIDVYRMIDEIDKALSNEIDQWLSSLNSLEKLNQKINNTSMEPIEFLFLKYERIFKGLVVAKLIDTEGYDEIESAYREICKGKPKKEQAFDKLVLLLQEK